MHCSFKITQTAENEFRYECVRCRRPVILDHIDLQLTARCFWVDPKAGLKRYVKLQQHADQLIWHFHYLTEEQVTRYESAFIEDAPDSTRIGTWLSAFFKKLGYEPAEGCYCNQLASTLDQASWNLIASNKKLVTEMILQSAAKMKKRPLRVNVRFALELALLRNKPKRDLRGDGNSSLQV